MHIVKIIQDSVIKVLENLYQQPFIPSDFQINQTKAEFEGDYTVVLFSLLKKTKLSPAKLGEDLGGALIANQPHIYASYNIINGFLNITVANEYWLDYLAKNSSKDQPGRQEANGKKVMVEYASPNTNKPLHLGHLRNIFLGWSIAEILKYRGYEVLKGCIVNDRGIHICKSMIAWQKFANGATPQTAGIKGDHFVGEYYVKFNDEYKKQVSEGLARGLDKDTAEKQTPILLEAQDMLLKWEEGDPEVKTLWAKMNGWVYEGFDETYKKIGSDFDRVYYESNTYLLGKEIVQQGIQKNVFFKKEDGSVWIDLEKEGLGEKLVLRKDGTSVYITQDIGLAQQRYEEEKIDRCIYVIGDEQNYHMKVLQQIAKHMGLPYAQDIYHLSYGMVELPGGKMKSREGTVVDADDIIDEMENVARIKTEELGKVKDFTTQELQNLYHIIGVGALKFFLLRVDPKKKMIFNPEESIDFHGFTGPFIQFNHARIKSILRKNKIDEDAKPSGSFLPLEKELLVLIERFSTTVAQASEEMNPAALAIYIYQLAKTFSSFYNEHSIAAAETEAKKQLRLLLSRATANTIKAGMNLLGIDVPERM